MADASTTVTLSTRPRKRSISSHRHAPTDNHSRTALIKTKIQKIDGQYKASPTCQEHVHSNDDLDEPLIVATVPPLVQDSSKYRTRQDVYDDETADDQHSNSSSLNSSPIAAPPSVTSNPVIETHSTPVKEKIDQIAVNTSMKHSTPPVDEVSVQPEPAVTPKKSTPSVSSSAIAPESTKPG